MKLASAILFIGIATAANASACLAAAVVPFVGCPSDGQIGPEPAPTGKDKTVTLDPRVAARVAFYQSKYDAGLLAPRGWHCIALEGSNGSILFVLPARRTADSLLTDAGIAGPGIQLTTSLGETSGRFEVARIVARYFPQRRAFVTSVIAEGIEPASHFPFGAYPADRVVQRDGRRIEVETPPEAQGLGSASRLRPDGLPIRSVAVIEGDPPNLVLLTVKLPFSLRALLPAIAGQLR